MIGLLAWWWMVLIALAIGAALLAGARHPRRRLAHAGAALCATLLLGAAALNPAWRASDDRLSVVFLLDESDSMGESGRANSQSWLERALAAQGPDDTFSVVRFGRDARVSTPDQPGGPVDRSATGLESAIRLARSLIPTDARGRMVLLSDGHETGGSVMTALSNLDDPAAPVLVVEGGGIGTSAEVGVTEITAPTSVRDGAAFEAIVAIESTVQTTARLLVAVNGGSPTEERVQLAPGTTRVTVPRRARSSGSATVQTTRVEVVAEQDTRSENNVIEHATVIHPAGHILVVEGSRGAGAQFIAAVRESGTSTEAAGPEIIPPRPEQLDRFDAVALADVAATQLTLDQQRTLVELVRTHGKGLLVLGGRASYALGGYAGTELAELLPVIPEPPTRRNEGTVGLYLVIDKSGSMEFGRREPSKIAMAREAATLALDSLRMGDTVGVLAFDARFSWIVQPQQIKGPTDVRAAQQRVELLKADGGTAIFPALEAAYGAAARMAADLKHIILLTDGQSASADYAALIQRMQPSRITLSTIGVGSDADTRLLTELAAMGSGRYYFTERAEDVPKITTKEAAIVTRSALVEGQIATRALEPSALLAPFGGRTLPAVSGYVSVLPRDRATTVLQTERGDPLLAHWRFGLGRVAAWTSDARGEWTTEWHQAPVREFWSQLVSWTMTEPTRGGLHAAATASGPLLGVRATAAGNNGGDVRATVIGPDGTAREIPLAASNGGQFEASVLAPARGTYQIRAYRAGAPESFALAAVAVNDSVEHGTVGRNDALLSRLMAASGGHAISDPSEAFARDGVVGRARDLPLWWWLAAAALLAYVVQIALRRLWT